MTVSFTDRVWSDIADLRAAIHALPFNREMIDGSLSRQRFQTYMVQDSLYLVAFSRALSLAAARAPDTDAMQAFGRSATEALVVERALHEDFFRRFGLDPAEAATADPSPTCTGYCSYLLATAATEPVEVLAAAVLPCFWIYWDVGAAIAKQATPDNPYQAWIDTYTDPGFGQAVETAIATTDRLAAGASPATVEAMRRAFIRCTQYEWMFWDSAYRLEDWPVAP